IAVHEPEGLTTASLPASSKISMNRSARERASLLYPVLKAGCPQQVCRSSKTTSHPARRSTSTALVPIEGHKWSTTQVMNKETRKNNYRFEVSTAKGLGRFSSRIITRPRPQAVLPCLTLKRFDPRVVSLLGPSVFILLSCNARTLPSRPLRRR